MNILAEILTGARSLIQDKKNWHQGGSAKDVQGFLVATSSATAFSFDGFGAIFRAGINLKASERDMLAAHHIVCGCVPGHSITIFNDTNEHEEVLKVFDQAILLALERDKPDRKLLSLYDLRNRP